jgi:hypothetical protein
MPAYRHTQPSSDRLNRRDWRVAVILAVVLAVGLVVGVLSTTTYRGPYGPSGHGCVNVMLASSTGGITTHTCGQAAMKLCQTAERTNSQAALATREQCHLAGVHPAVAPPAG